MLDETAFGAGGGFEARKNSGGRFKTSRLAAIWFLSNRRSVRILRIGRAAACSPKWQAESVARNCLPNGHGSGNRHHKTSGDKMQQAPLTQIGARDFYQRAGGGAAGGSIDLAVHTAEDVPTDIPSRLMFPAVCRVMMCVIAGRLHAGESPAGSAVWEEQSRRQAQ